MKKLFLTLMCLCSLIAKTNGDMWTLYNLPDTICNQMQKYG